MVTSRIFENLLTILVLGGLGWILYQHFQGNDTFSNFKDKMGKVIGGNKNGRFGFRRN